MMLNLIIKKSIIMKLETINDIVGRQIKLIWKTWMEGDTLNCLMWLNLFHNIVFVTTEKNLFFSQLFYAKIMHAITLSA